MTDSWLRGGAFVVGLLLVFAFLQSVLRVAVVNRQRGDRLARGIGALVYALVARRTLRRHGYDRIQAALAWVLPIYIMSLISCWFLLVQTGFALLIWSLQAEHSLLQALIASGSALSTLGFLTPPDISGQLLAIPEGALGLGLVVFFFTFIPGYQSAIQARESKVAWLYARAGVDPTVGGFLDWLQRSGNAADAAAIWEEWESWFRTMVETHTVAPIIAMVPSVHRGQSWVVAAGVILDASSFWLSTADEKARLAAGLCHATGIRALRLIAAEHHAKRAFHATAVRHCVFDRAAYAAACDRMAALSGSRGRDTNEGWNEFVKLRGEYEIFLTQLAANLLVPIERSVALAPGE